MVHAAYDERSLTILSPEVTAALAAPLDPARVSKRAGGGGKQLSYLEGWDVKQKANEIFGFGNWGYRTVELRHIGTEPFTSGSRSGFRTGYTALVEVWLRDGATVSDVGYGDATEYSDSQIKTHELASKEAVTDGLKRAFASLGDQFGLCLYDKTAPEHDGVARDPDAELKAVLTSHAIDNGATATAEGIAEFYEVTPEQLKDPEVLRSLARFSTAAVR